VLDVGAGTGVASVALVAKGALPLAMDLSHDMLAYGAAARPPCAVADVRALPLAAGAVDDSVAAFVLNHLVDPRTGLAELVRVTRRKGVVLACVYSNASRSQVRDVVDETARKNGWQTPDWYVHLKTCATLLLGSADGMRRAAAAAGLIDVAVDEVAVDVGVTEPAHLVNYRFGQAQFSAWSVRIGSAAAEEVRQHAIETIRPIMRPYRPLVVFLTASVHT
jgi:SAM-dependent methyltransferase